MKARKILIIDDDVSRVEGIKKALEKFVETELIIYPAQLSGSLPQLENINHIIDLIKINKYEELVKHYKEVDIYIIDQCLKGSNDNLGVKFIEAVQQEKLNPDAKFYLISSNPLNAGIDLSKFYHFDYIQKYNFGRSFNRILVKRIVEKENLSYVEGAEETLKSEFNYRTVLFRDNSKQVLDFVLTFMFLSTILIIACYSLFKIVDSLVFSNDHGETGILKNSEHIFLYILPVFILLGFYIYYANNVSIPLRDGKLFTDPMLRTDESSTRTMNFTKLMFISSIVSFIIVKIIDLAVSDTKESYEDGKKVIINIQEVPLDRIIPLGALLIILMSYYLILNKKEH